MFDPKRKFEVISPFDSSKPFEQEISEPEVQDLEIENLKSELLGIQNKLVDKEKKRQEFNKKMMADIKSLVKSEIGKSKVTQEVIERIIEKKVIEPRYIEPRVIQAPPTPPTPPQIIKEVRVEVQSSSKELAALRKQIEELQQKLEEKPKNPAYPMEGWGFRTGKVIPSLSGNDGKYLRAKGSKLVFESVAASGGGLTPGTFTINNNTPAYTFDATTSTVDELYQIVATLIRTLQGEI